MTTSPTSQKTIIVSVALGLALSVAAIIYMFGPVAQSPEVFVVDAPIASISAQAKACYTTCMKGGYRETNKKSKLSQQGKCINRCK